MTVSSDVTRQIEAKQAFGQAICERIAQAIGKLALPESVGLKPPQFNDAEFMIVIDPYSQSQDLVGFWYNAGKQRIGQIRFNGDGSFYAEFDVVQPHPSKKNRFVEAINAWGKEDNIKAEAKLLEMPQ